MVLRPTSATGRAAGDLDLCRKQAKPAYQPIDADRLVVDRGRSREKRVLGDVKKPVRACSLSLPKGRDKSQKVGLRSRSLDPLRSEAPEDIELINLANTNGLVLEYVEEGLTRAYMAAEEKILLQYALTVAHLQGKRLGVRLDELNQMLPDSYRVRVAQAGDNLLFSAADREVLRNGTQDYFSLDEKSKSKSVILSFAQDALSRQKESFESEKSDEDRVGLRTKAAQSYQHCLTALQDSDFFVQSPDLFVQHPDLFVQHPGLFMQYPDLFVEENLLWATYGFNLYRGDEKTEGRFPVFLKYAVARAQLVSWNTATQLTCDTINNEMSRFGFEGFAVREVREGEVALFSADDCKALYASLAPFLFLECPDDLITEVLVDKKIVKELVVKKTKQCMLWQAEQALHLQSQSQLQLQAFYGLLTTPEKTRKQVIDELIQIDKLAQPIATSLCGFEKGREKLNPFKEANQELALAISIHAALSAVAGDHALQSKTLAQRLCFDPDYKDFFKQALSRALGLLPQEEVGDVEDSDRGIVGIDGIVGEPRLPTDAEADAVKKLLSCIAETVPKVWVNAMAITSLKRQGINFRDLNLGEIAQEFLEVQTTIATTELSSSDQIEKKKQEAPQLKKQLLSPELFLPGFTKVVKDIDEAQKTCLPDLLDLRDSNYRCASMKRLAKEIDSLIAEFLPNDEADEKKYDREDLMSYSQELQEKIEKIKKSEEAAKTIAGDRGGEDRQAL